MLKQIKLEGGSPNAAKPWLPVAAGRHSRWSVTVGPDAAIGCHRFGGFRVQRR